MLADIESAQARNRPFTEIKTIVEKRAQEYMELHSDKSGRAFNIEAERKKDQYSHFVLRLAFCRSYVEWLRNQREDSVADSKSRQTVKSYDNVSSRQRKNCFAFDSSLTNRKSEGDLLTA